MQNLSREAVKSILDTIYLLAFALMTGYYFIGTTTFQVLWPNYFYVNLRILLFVLVIVRAYFDQNEGYTEIILGTITALVFLIAWQHNQYQVLSDITLLLLGAKGMPFKRIVKTYFVVCGILLVVTIFCALSGTIENFVIHQDGRGPRIAFGSIYPTDFSAHIFYLIISYCYIRKEKLKYIELGAMTAAGVFVFVFCGARLNTICIFVTVLCMGYNKIRYEKALKNETTYIMNPLFSAFLCMSTTFFSILMIGMTLLYSTNSKWSVFLDRVLNSRLRLGKKGIDLYELSVFGQQIGLIGSGNSMIQPPNYFFLDVSYIYVLLQYGILVLGVALLLFLVMGLKARKERDWTMLWLIAIVSLQCTVEHHMLDISYNILLWGALAYLGTDTMSSNRLKKYKLGRGKQNESISSS